MWFIDEIDRIIIVRIKLNKFSKLNNINLLNSCLFSYYNAQKGAES